MSGVSMRGNGGLANAESMELRWALKDEEGTSDELEDSIGRSCLEEESDDDGADSEHQRLIRTGPRVDSFDVEALEVPGYEVNGFNEVKRFNFSCVRFCFGDLLFTMSNINEWSSFVDCS
jgi:hypothetical protein